MIQMWWLQFVIALSIALLAGAVAQSVSDRNSPRAPWPGEVRELHRQLDACRSGKPEARPTRTPEGRE